MGTKAFYDNSSSSSKSARIAAFRVFVLLCDSMLVESSLMLSAILENSDHLWLCKSQECIWMGMHIHICESILILKGLIARHDQVP